MNDYRLVNNKKYKEKMKKQQKNKTNIDLIWSQIVGSFSYAGCKKQKQKNEVNIHTMTHLTCIRLVSLRSSNL